MVNLIKYLETVEAIRDVCLDGIILPKGFKGRVLKVVQGDEPAITVGTEGETYRGLDPRDFEPTGERSLIKFLSTNKIALSR